MNNSSYLNANLLDLPTQITVYDGNNNQIAQTVNTYDGSTPVGSGVTQHHNIPTATTRGNLTLSQKWLNTTGGLVQASSTSYYDTGMPYLSYDLFNRSTQFTYSSANYGSYVTQTTYPTTGSTTHAVSGTYDFNTGLLTQFTDQNGQSSSYGYDLLGRILSGSYPDTGSVSVAYTDTIPVQIQKTVKVTGSLNKVTNSVFDGLGRPSQMQAHDPDCTTGSALVKVDYGYGYDTSQFTRYATTTTPYCDQPGTLYGLPIRTDSDVLGRAVKLTQSDGAIATTSYSQNTTTVTDEAGITRKSQMDGLGRMTTVWEDPNGKNYETDYVYNGLDNLTTVTQKGDGSGNRVRTFGYDSLSRLTSATNPETGTISYAYSNSPSGCAGLPSIVCSKSTPKPATTTYAYDALNRLAQKSYNDGTAAVKVGYDGVVPSGCSPVPPSLTDSYPKPLRTAMCDASGATAWSHDTMGRALSEMRTLNSATKTTSYTYNYDGSLKKLTYPGSARVITYAQNGSSSYTSGRPASAIESTGINYVTGATYAPFGGMTGMTNGSTGSF